MSGPLRSIQYRTKTRGRKTANGIELNSIHHIFINGVSDNLVPCLFQCEAEHNSGILIIRVSQTADHRGGYATHDPIASQ